MFGTGSGIPEFFPTENKMERSQSRKTGLSRDLEGELPERSRRYFSWFLMEKIWFPGNGIWEPRPLIFTVTLFANLPNVKQLFLAT